MRVVHPFGLVPPAVGIASKPLPRAIAGISNNSSLLLAVIRRFCWLFLAVIFSPLLSKLQGFCGRDRGAWLFFVG
jgi:hypothetical protein